MSCRDCQWKLPAGSLEQIILVRQLNSLSFGAGTEEKSSPLLAEDGILPDAEEGKQFRSLYGSGIFLLGDLYIFS